MAGPLTNPYAQQPSSLPPDPGAPTPAPEAITQSISLPGMDITAGEKAAPPIPNPETSPLAPAALNPTPQANAPTPPDANLDRQMAQDGSPPPATDPFEAAMAAANAAVGIGPKDDDGPTFQVKLRDWNQSANDEAKSMSTKQKEANVDLKYGADGTVFFKKEGMKKFIPLASDTGAQTAYNNKLSELSDVLDAPGYAASGVIGLGAAAAFPPSIPATLGAAVGSATAGYGVQSTQLGESLARAMGYPEPMIKAAQKQSPDTMAVQGGLGEVAGGLFSGILGQIGKANAVQKTILREGADALGKVSTLPGEAAPVIGMSTGGLSPTQALIAGNQGGENLIARGVAERTDPRYMAKIAARERQQAASVDGALMDIRKDFPVLTEAPDARSIRTIGKTPDGSKETFIDRIIGRMQDNIARGTEKVSALIGDKIAIDPDSISWVIEPHVIEVFGSRVVDPNTGRVAEAKLRALLQDPNYVAPKDGLSLAKSYFEMQNLARENRAINLLEGRNKITPAGVVDNVIQQAEQQRGAPLTPEERANLQESIESRVGASHALVRKDLNANLAGEPETVSFDDLAHFIKRIQEAADFKPGERSDAKVALGKVAGKLRSFEGDAMDLALTREGKATGNPSLEMLGAELRNDRKAFNQRYSTFKRMRQAIAENMDFLGRYAVENLESKDLALLTAAMTGKEKQELAALAIDSVYQKGVERAVTGQVSHVNAPALYQAATENPRSRANLIHLMGDERFARFESAIKTARMIDPNARTRAVSDAAVKGGVASMIQQLSRSFPFSVAIRIARSLFSSIVQEGTKPIFDQAIEKLIKEEASRARWATAREIGFKGIAKAVRVAPGARDAYKASKPFQQPLVIEKLKLDYK